MIGEVHRLRDSIFMQRRSAEILHYKVGHDISSDTEDSQSYNASSGGEGCGSYEEINFQIKGPRFELFDHQVSGHMPLISSGCGRIGKPAVPQEVAFYEKVLSLYPCLRSFAPTYWGCLDMSYSEIEALSSEIKLCDKDEIDFREESPGSISDSYWTTEPLPRTVNRSWRRKRTSNFDAGPRAKMWGKFMKRYCRELSSKWEDDRKRSVKFILLEDLTFPFRKGKASILDIKLGTRQYRLGASPEKERSQYLKSRTTTTGQFGLRLNGMRIWNSTTETFIVRDKYWGRSIQSDTLGPAIREFFNDGGRIRREVIPPLIALIEQLSSAIEAAEDSCRFYSSSVLLIYDGMDYNTTDGHRIEPHVDVRMIDFANSLSKIPGSVYHEPIDLSNHPEDGCLTGLSNLIKFLTEILESE